MRNRSVLKLAGVLSLVSPLSILAAMPFAFRVRGFGGPGPISFGDAHVLERLHAAQSAAILVDTFALIGPTLAFGIGFGWYLILRRTSVLAAYGTLLWYVGLIFIVAQDALQLAFVSTLPGEYVAATDSVKPAILAIGDSLAYAIVVLSNVGSVSYVGAFIVYLVALRTIEIPRWIGYVGAFATGLVLLSSILVPALPQIPVLAVGQPIGIIANILLNFAWGAVMLRWKQTDEVALA